MKVPTTKQELFALNLDADDFPINSDAYYAQYAIDAYGSEVRDNSFSDLVEIGKSFIQETST